MDQESAIQSLEMYTPPPATPGDLVTAQILVQSI